MSNYSHAQTFQGNQLYKFLHIHYLNRFHCPVVSSSINQAQPSPKPLIDAAGCQLQFTHSPPSHHSNLPP